MTNSASKPLPSKYVIAQPESYAAFDVSAPPPRALLLRSQNVKDRDAAVPLMAHVAYWKNKTVWTQLLEQIAP
jgi:hypothetical protein